MTSRKWFRVAALVVTVALAWSLGCRQAAEEPKQEKDPPEEPKKWIFGVEDDGETVVRKAVEANGGEKTFSRWRCGHFEYEAVAKGRAALIEDTFQLPDHFKRVVYGKGDKAPFTLAFVIDRGKVRTKSGDGTIDEVKAAPPPKMVHEYAGLCSPAGLLKEKRNMKVLGRGTIGKREILAVRVQAEDQGHNDFYFDVLNGRLLKAIRPRQEAEAASPLFGEASLDDFKEIQGAMVPMRATARQEGKVIYEVRVQKLRFEEKIDPSVFVLP
jgi:hypothetical protein